MEGEPINHTDPSGQVSEGEKFYLRLWGWAMQDTTIRLNVESLTGLTDEAFASMIGAKILMEDATVFGDNADWKDIAGEMWFWDTPDAMRDDAEIRYGGGEISWGPLNIPLPLAKRGLAWWEQNYACLGFDFSDLHTNYFNARDNGLWRLLSGRSETQNLVADLHSAQGGIEAMGLAMLESSSRARNYWSAHGEPSHTLSAYTIALGVVQFREKDVTLYTLSEWTGHGSQWHWVEAIDEAGEILGFHLVEPGDYLRYTSEEKLKLDTLGP